MSIVGYRDTVRNELAGYFGGRCLFNEKLADKTSYKIGGRADILVSPSCFDDWAYLKKFCIANNLDLTILGAGTNVLVSDDGIAGITATTDNMSAYEFEDNLIKAQSGVLLDKVVEQSCLRGLGGMEKLSGIPGTVGGAVFMNAGAFGQEAMDCLEDFTCLGADGNIRTMLKKDIEYGYRFVEGLEGAVVLSAVWRLTASPKDELLKTRNETIKARWEKQPLEFPSAGSVFKRPPDNYASKLIDDCGLKGFRVGGAGVSEKHAGFIINDKNATARDVYALINKIQTEVLHKTGIKLELEQKLLGRF